MRKLKIFTFLLALVASVGMSWATSQPIGYVDVCTAHPGSIHLVGWANDPDALSTSLPIHVYVDQPNGGNSYINQHGYNLGTTDVYRVDGVNPQYTGYHKIDRYIDIMEASGAGTYRIRAYALDAVGNDGNPLMPHSYLSNMPTTATLTVPAPYSITYNANGGNGAPAADYKCYGINKTLSSTVPTRDGYTFIGWNTEQNGSGTSYAKGATYSANASATLYAKWTANTYKVKFNGNGNTGGSMSDQNFTYGTAQNLTANAFSRTGYTFAGWATSSGGAKAYNDKQSVNNLTATNGGTFNLYAVWTVNQYTITFDGNGGSSVASITQNYGTTIAAPADPTRDGYTFAGWEPALPETMPAQNMTVVAQWNVIPTPDPQPSSMSAEFAYCYDCWREPAYPKTSGQCNLFNFGNPGVGNKNPSGPWKLEFVEYYNSSSTEYGSIVDEYVVANQYGKSPEQMEVYRLYQWQNGAYQPVAYGVLYAYANESNPVEHAAFFEANGYYGCYLTGNTHSGGDDFNILFDEDAATGFGDLHGGGGSTPDPQQDPTIFAGFTATAGCDGFGGEDHTKLVDGKFTSGDEGVDWTKWCADGQHKSVPSGESESCWWVDFNAENPINVTGYILTTGNDNTQYGQGRNPDSWKIKAKLNENDPWTTIANVQNDNTMQVADFTDFSFTLDQTGTYKYFRFMVYEPEYDNCMQLCELRFTGNGGSTPTPTINDILQELYDALGNDVWAGYGDATGVITYAQGTEPNSFKATFMGGAYAIEIPFGDFTYADKVDNGDGTFTYNLNVNLPAQTGMDHEVLHVTTNANGEITGIESELAETEMNKLGGAIASWADLNAAMANGGVLQLSQSLTATNLDGALIVPAGKTVVLDLNGFSLDRHLGSAQADGCVIINNGTLAITDNVGGAEIKGGYNSGNGGGIVNNGTFTLYGGKITGNHAAQGAGVYNSVANDGNVGFWMTGGLIAENEAASYPAIKGDVTFSNLAVVQINAQGATVSATTAIAGLATYDYIKPVMPNMDMFAILAELHAALGNDVWAGYGEATGVITYAQGTEPNSFKATFMGGAYAIEIPFGDFTYADKVDNGDGTFTYNLNVNLPAQTGMDHEVLHVTTNANGEITGIESELAETEMNKLGGAIASWADLNAAMANGGVLQLSQSLTATNLDGALIVPAGKTVVLDLNGFSLDRHLGSAQADGCVIINNGTLAITDNVGGAEIKGGYNSGNGGGIVNNGTFTLYGGKITGNHAAQGAGVYNSVANDGNVGFWMTGGLIAENEAASYPAIKGDVTFSNLAVVQINAQGATVSATTAIAGLATYDYIKPVMPNMDMFAILAELHAALGSDVWTGYGVNTGVMSYSQGDEANEFRVSFMGGTYTIDLPFGDFTSATKADNGDGTFTYTLTVNLPAQTGMDHEVLHVTTNANGEITAIHSDNAEVDLKKETNGTIATWADLQNALNEGGLIKLTNDIAGGDAPLVIPENTTVVLDLNGFTIDRGMTDAAENGSVIVNNGTLAIVDHSELANGVITGGKTTGNGGGVLNNGIFTLYGGEITGNAAANGGGVYNNGGAQGFWMTGGLIDGNSASSYPAICGAVIFNAQAVVQINADGDKVSIEEALAGMATYSYIKPVMPDYDDYTTEVAITANEDPNSTGIYYSTFYDSANKYALPAGVEAYVADLSGSDLVLTKIAGAGQVIPADEAVILRASVQNFSLLPSFEAPVSVSTNNDLEGVDEATPVTSIAGLTAQNCYVLSGTPEYGVGFYKIKGNTLKAHKAYVKYAGSQNGAPRRMRFVFGTATGMESIQNSAVSSQKVIENGVLYIIKNGVRYNVQGQIVK